MPSKGSRARVSNAERVQRHRVRSERSGRTRVEVSVPSEDAELIRTLAERLRAGKTEAASVRAAFATLGTRRRARNGKQLLAFFRASPLVGEDLLVERDSGLGRDPPL